jgi:putative heme iron utilization protein
MADHQVTHKWEKGDSAFSSVQEAIETLLADSPATETIMAEYTTWADAQTNFTETRKLLSGGEPVSAGTAGNGFSYIRTFSETDLQAHITAEKAANASYPTSPYEGNGWSVTSIDINPATGVEYAGDWND